MDHISSPDLFAAMPAAVLAVALFVALMSMAALRVMAGDGIPPRLILWLAAGYTTLAPLAGFAAREMFVSLGVAAMVFFATVAAIALGGMERGTGLLVTVAALWLGPGAVAPFLILTLLFGAATAFSLASLRLLPAGGPKGYGKRIAWQVIASGGCPAALPIALAACLSLAATPWFDVF